MEKIAAMMVRPGQDGVIKDDVPWWLRFAGRAAGSVGGSLAIFLGLLNLITFSPMSFLASIVLIFISLVVLSVEATCCCMFLGPVQMINDFAEGKPYWMRAVAYIGMALVPIIISANFSIIFGSGLILLTGIVYAIMALGKKATAEEMRQAAAAAQTSAPSSGTSSNMRSNLVANAQPISFTGAPVFDSNV